MALKKGDILKVKLDFFKEKLKTRTGIFDLVIGNFLWGFLIVQYNELAFGAINMFFSFIAWNWLRNYLSYTVFGLILIPLSIGITILTTQLFKFLNKLKTKLLGGK